MYRHTHTHKHTVTLLVWIMAIMNYKSLLSTKPWKRDCLKIERRGWAHRSCRCNSPNKKCTRKDCRKQTQYGKISHHNQYNLPSGQKSTNLAHKGEGRTEKQQDKNMTTTTTTRDENYRYNSWQQITNQKNAIHKLKNHTSNPLHNVSDKVWNKVELVHGTFWLLFWQVVHCKSCSLSLRPAHWPQTRRLRLATGS